MLPATLTPSRQITVTLDPQETVEAEPFFAYHRDRFEIKEPTLTNVEQLASGVWILKPEATNLFSLHENTAGQIKAIRLTEWNSITPVAEFPVQRDHAELTGVSPSVTVSPTGDYFFTKRITAGGTWNHTLPPTRPVPPVPTTPNYPLDTVVQHVGALEPPDQGYVVRWIAPAHPLTYNDFIFSFLFGGDLTADGYGQFELALTGDGQAHLFEWIGGAWSKVDEWRWSPPGLVAGRSHTLRIIPHALRYIECRTSVADHTQPGVLYQNNHMAPFAGRHVDVPAHVYEVTNRAGLPPRGGGFGYNVTGAGHPEFRVRRDILLRWQVARVTYPASGTLRDQAFTVECANLSTHVLAVRVFSTVLYNPLTNAPHGAATGAVFNAQTGGALAGASENWTIGGNTFTVNGFTLPGNPNAVKVELTLTNNDGAGGPWSPWVYGYEAFKIGTTQTNTNAALVIGEDHFRQSPVERLYISAPDADPSHETASMVVRDLVNRASRLNTRGEGRVRVVTSYDFDPTKQSVLFDGYFIKSNGRQRGKAGMTYPSPAWHDYDLTCMGMWKMLHERDYTSNTMIVFSKDIDPNATPVDGQAASSKVTDAIRLLLVGVGVPEFKTNIPDLGVRLYMNQKQENSIVVLNPGENVAQFIRHLCEDYLNYFLVWDANAGTEGQWRIKPIPLGTEAPVWTFTDQLPAPGHIATHEGSYPAGTTFIARDTLHEWTVPPEGNWLRVTGQFGEQIIKRHKENPKAFNRPGAATADPTSPDYTDGRFRPIFRRHDASLTGQTRQQAEAAVGFVLRRVFDLACRAQRFARFTCPLPLIDAAALEPSVYTTHRKRPPMFGDVVLYRGNRAMVRGCSPMIRKAHHQLCQMEIVRFNDPLPV